MAGERIQISGAAAGAQGSPFRKLLAFTGKAVGSYVINDTNFPGIGPFLPTWAHVEGVNSATGTTELQISNDNGTTWFRVFLNSTASQGFGMTIYLDSASTWRIVIATAATDIRFWVM